MKLDPKLVEQCEDAYYEAAGLVCLKIGIEAILNLLAERAKKLGYGVSAELWDHAVKQILGIVEDEE